MQNLRAVVLGNPMAHAHILIGDTWTQLILREAFFGTRRFSDWQSALAVPRTVLSMRLRALVKSGLMEIRDSPTRKSSEYRLTEMGRDLFGVAIIQGLWERKHAPSVLQLQYSLDFHDTRSGADVRPVVLDRPYGQPVDPKRTTYSASKNLIEPVTRKPRRLSTPRVVAQRPFIERSVEMIGDYWSWVAIGAAFFRQRRFDDFLAATGMASNILTDRLNRLVDAGIFFRKAYQDRPARYEYRLSPMGLDLYPLIMAMFGWAERWLCDAANPSLELFEKETGERIIPTVCNQLTGEPLKSSWVRWSMSLENPQ